MFAQNPLNFTNVNSLLSSQNRVFDAQGGNTISAVMSHGGAYAGKKRYVVNYAKPTGTLQSKGHDTLHQAMADARSGDNSSVKSFYFTSYWQSDEWLATWNGAPKGLAKDVQTTPQPLPAPAPAPTPAPTPIEIDTVNPEEDTETDDPSITQENDGGTTDSTESGDDTTPITTEEPTEEKSNMGIFAIVGLAIGGIGYYFFSKKK